MRHDDTSRVLAKAAAFDGRTVDAAMIAAWSEALPASVTLPDALRAVTAHYRATSRLVMPSDVIAAVGVAVTRRADALPAGRILAALPARQPMPESVRPKWDQLRADLEARTRAREAS